MGESRHPCRTPISLVSYAAVEEDGTSGLVIEVFDDLDKVCADVVLLRGCPPWFQLTRDELHVRNKNKCFYTLLGDHPRPVQIKLKRHILSLSLSLSESVLFYKDET